jgi:hypothetical protein
MSTVAVTGRGDVPIVVHFHGGGFRSGNIGQETARLGVRGLRRSVGCKNCEARPLIGQCKI